MDEFRLGDVVSFNKKGSLGIFLRYKSVEELTKEFTSSMKQELLELLMMHSEYCSVAILTDDGWTDITIEVSKLKRDTITTMKIQRLLSEVGK